MSIFNINDYKTKSKTDVDYEELDRRYVNSEGDTMNQLICKTISLYDTGAISFVDGSVQTKGFTQDYIDNTQNQINNINPNILLNSSNTWNDTNNFKEILSDRMRLKDNLGSNLSTHITMVGNNLNIVQPINGAQIRLVVNNYGTNYQEIPFSFNPTGLNINNKDVKNIRNLLFFDNTTQNTAFTTEHINLINNMNDKLTDISYDSSNDTTTINNNLKITNNYGIGDSTPQIQIINPNPEINYETLIISGVLGGNYNSIVKTNDTGIYNRKVGLMDLGSGICLTGHSHSKYGLRVDVNGGTSELHCSNFEINSNIDMKTKNITNATNISANTITLNGQDLNTRLEAINQNSGSGLVTDNIIDRGDYLDITGSKLNVNCNLDMKTKNITNATNVITGLITLNGVDLNTRLATMETKLTDITYDITTDTTMINNNLDMKTKNIINTANLSANTISLSGVDLNTRLGTMETKLTDISYDAPTDTTLINNHLNMNGKNIRNTKTMNFVSNTATPNTISNIFHDDLIFFIENKCNGGEIYLKTTRFDGTKTRSLFIDYDRIGFDERELTNCPTIRNVKNIIITNGSGSNTELTQNNNNFWIRNTTNDANIELINLTNGGASSRNMKISYNDVNFDNRTISNTPTITNIQSNITNLQNSINTINTNMSLNIIGRAMCKISHYQGAYVMDYNHNDTFAKILPLNAIYIKKKGTGRITMMIRPDIGINNTNFYVMAQGTWNGGGTSSDAGNTLIISNPFRSSYIENGVILGYTFDLNITRTSSAGTFTDLATGGFMDIMVMG